MCCEAGLEEAPDIVVGLALGYRASWQTALGPAPEGEVVVGNHEAWSGDHLVDAAAVPGIFLSNVRCMVRNPRLIDVGPTVLEAMGINVAEAWLSSAMLCTPDWVAWTIWSWVRLRLSI